MAKTASNADREAFLKAVAVCKWGVHNNEAWVGSRMSDDIGFVSTVPIVAGFAALDPDAQAFVADAMMAAFGTRAGQNSKAKTAAEYTKAVHESLHGKGGEDDRLREKDALVAALAEQLTPAILKTNPTATQKDIRSNVADQIGTLAKPLARVINDGYKPLAKEKKTEKAALSTALAALAE